MTNGPERPKNIEAAIPAIESLNQLVNQVAAGKRSIDIQSLPQDFSVRDLPDVDPRIMNSELLLINNKPFARYFSFHADAWQYLPLNKDNPEQFSVSAINDRSPNHLIQFAGPMTAKNGNTLGVSVSEGQVEQAGDSGSSGFALITKGGQMQIVSRNFLIKKFGSVNDWIAQVVKPKQHSVFQAPLMVTNGAITPSVKNWNFWKKNRAHNYRFLVEYKDGSKGVFDFHRAKKSGQGFQEVLTTMIRAGVRNAMYMDVAGSEYGTFLAPDGSHALGGKNAHRIHEDDSPGGFLMFSKPDTP